MVNGVSGSSNGNNNVYGQKGKAVQNLKQEPNGLYSRSVFDSSGKEISKTYYFDFHPEDHQITEDEIYIVEKYTNTNNGRTVERFWDNSPHDGYADQKDVFYQNKTPNGYVTVDETKKTETYEDINSVKQRPHADHEVVNRQMSLIQSGMAIQSQQSVSGSQNEDNLLNNVLKFSTLSDTKISEESILAKGFEGGKYNPYMGGKAYYNHLTGEELDVYNANSKGRTIQSYLKGNMMHAVVYDKNGKALGGELYAKQGKDTIYLRYSVDENGNKTILKSENMGDTIVALPNYVLSKERSGSLWNIQNSNNTSSVQSAQSSQGSASKGKIATENFQKEIMSVLDISKSKHNRDTVNYYLGKLIKVAQEQNGVRNLKPQGTSEQNKLYYIRLEQRKRWMQDFATHVGSGLTLVQDSNTGLYKFCVNNKIYDIPERNVKIGILETDLRDELAPEIID